MLEKPFDSRVLFGVVENLLGGLPLVQPLLLSPTRRQGPGGLFGTKDGSFGDRNSRTDVELRMNAIALILKHEDFAIRTQNRVPGRERPTVRLGVDLTIRGALIDDVAFLVVQSNSGAWLIEEIDLVKVTSS